jgi:hypothetical protein
MNVIIEMQHTVYERRIDVMMRLLRMCAILLMITSSIVSGIRADDEKESAMSAEWTDSFPLDECNFSDTGQNKYFILEPGYQLILKGVEDYDSVTLVITVLDETQQVDGVLTRIVEERESVGGELIEVSRNFFAFCRTYGSIFYFGEDVDIFEDGQVAGHEGTWQAGDKGFRPGLMMPGLPLVGASYYQEIAPKVAMDRARIVNTDTTINTPWEVYEHCLVTEETSDLEPNSKEYKFYAPRIGLIRDGQLWLVNSRITENQE